MNHDDEYEDPVEELAMRIVDRAAGTPQVRKAIRTLEDLFNTVGRGIDVAGDFIEQGNRRGRSPRVEVRERVRYQTRVVEKPVEKPQDPRQVLGFPPDFPLTRELIKQRQRALSGLWHPDKPGGSTEAMQRLNAAADALLSEIG